MENAPWKQMMLHDLSMTSMAMLHGKHVDCLF